MAVAAASILSLSVRALAAPEPLVQYAGHVPAAVAFAQPLGRLERAAPVSLALVLPLHNTGRLSHLLGGLYDPADPLYHQFLTPAQFEAQFGATQSDADAVAGWAAAHGLAVTGGDAGHQVLDVTGPPAAVEAAFGVRLNQYQSGDGRVFRAPDADPAVPVSVAAHLAGVVGLDTAAVRHPHVRTVSPDALPLARPATIGSGPAGGLTPSDIQSAYGLSGVAANGAGQTLAVFELDGYSASDITQYESDFGLPAVPVQAVPVDGGSGRLNSNGGAAEVTLDIELQIAGAPGARQVLVYEGPNTDQGLLDTYSRIAADDQAKEISTSWGLDEPDNTSSYLQSENVIFARMAAQGQTVFAAAGDSGAYDTGSAADGLAVDDPASQPYVTGVGGTTLSTSGRGGAWAGETVWNSGSVFNGAGGGGVSAFWPLPSWQQGVVSAASHGSTTMRNVPDVALNADPSTGYAIFYGGRWQVYGGTSCAAPLWAAFTARVNQQRLANGGSPIGFLNPTLYQLGASGKSDFHDIVTGTNLFFPAVSGYDDATGWGSFNGSALLAALAGGVTTTPVTTTPVTTPTPTVTKPAAPMGLSATAGDTTVTLTWTAVPGATGYNVYRSTTSAGGYGKVSTGTGTSSTETGLSDGTTYYYLVTATNSGGESGDSNPASATPVSPSLTITGGPSVSVSVGRASITWTTKKAASTAIKFGTSPGSLPYSGSSATPITQHTATLSGLGRRTTYYYVVSDTLGSVTVSSSVSSFTSP